MADPFTLDQLRTLLLVSEHGSFSAAARKLGRVQSAVSQSMANLESELGVVLWNRGARAPTLTEQGREAQQGVRVRGLSTHYGILDYTIENDRVHIGGSLRVPPKGIVVKSPSGGADIVVRTVPWSGRLQPGGTPGQLEPRDTSGGLKPAAPLSKEGS